MAAKPQCKESNHEAVPGSGSTSLFLLLSGFWPGRWKSSCQWEKNYLLKSSFWPIFPQGWDRTRRCDQQDYEIPCGPCEGNAVQLCSLFHIVQYCRYWWNTYWKWKWWNYYAFLHNYWWARRLPWTYPTCVGDTMDPSSCIWNSHWTEKRPFLLPNFSRGWLGKLFVTFSPLSDVPLQQKGDLCYRKQTGSKVYDMLENRAYREDLELETPVGNMTSTIIHQVLDIYF